MRVTNFQIFIVSKYYKQFELKLINLRFEINLLTQFILKLNKNQEIHNYIKQEDSFTLKKATIQLEDRVLFQVMQQFLYFDNDPIFEIFHNNIMFTQINLILLRHAEAPHNSPSIHLSNPPVENQSSSHLHTLATQRLLKDVGITENGVKQCKQISQILNWDSIGLIVVSPLKRCLQTCQNLLNFSHKQVNVIVQPNIAAKVSKIWSLGSSKKQLERQYPLFSFKQLWDSEDIPWYFRNFGIQKQKKIQDLKEKQKCLELGITQDFYEFRMRIEQFKKSLRNYLGGVKEGQRILIISHNQVFSMLTARLFLENGKAISDFKFGNSQMKFMAAQKIFQYSVPYPSL